MLKHVKVGGRIVCYNLVGMNWEETHPIEYFEELVEELNEDAQSLKKAGLNGLLETKKQNIAKAKEMCDSDFKNFDYKKIGYTVVFERVK